MERATSFDVRIWGIQTRTGRRKPSYRVRWVVAGEPFALTFATRALADSERSDLISAARRGEAFDRETGLPLSRVPDNRATTWWDWTLIYVDIKWPDLAPRSRRAVAEALMAPTLALSTSDRGKPDEKELRSAMFAWAFNTPARKVAPLPPSEFAAAIRWLSNNSRRLLDLTDDDVARAALSAISRKVDGTTAAPTTIARKRAVMYNVLEFAVDKKLLDSNPLDEVRWRAPKASEVLDPRVVANPTQARALLESFSTIEGGARYRAFFGCMYYSALRPSEVVALEVSALDLPLEGWGWLILSENDPEVTGTWTDSGERQARQLKHRARGAVRPVPCPPALTQLLHEHMRQFPPSAEGRLFYGAQGGTIASRSYTRMWQSVRKSTLTLREADSPVVRRPYDLRHSALSTWMAAGVDSAQVAAWAGHSIAVLHRVYAHVLSGREDLARLRIDSVLASESGQLSNPPTAPVRPHDPASDVPLQVND